jgi:quercetin dioxygenase-like cupin family protein
MEIPMFLSQLSQALHLPSCRSALLPALLIAAYTCFTSSAFAAELPKTQPITRTVLEQHPIPGTDQVMEVMLITLQPGVSAPLHHHSVAGLGYILEGKAESAYGNDAPKLYGVGDTFQDVPTTPHTVFRNPDPHNVLRFLVFTNLHQGQAYTVTP